MKWTKAKRYQKYQGWDAKTLLDLQTQAATSPYQMHYHIHPLSGLINDPNGFSFYNGEYHVFCQSFPFGSVHGLKSWIHYASQDLVHWHYLGQAINPDTKEDNAGAYSGSAMPYKGKLILMYTGNHRDSDWTRIPYQIIAEMNPHYQITKHSQPAILPPDHVSEHFRDPQLFKKQDKYYVLLGAQDKKTKTGHFDLYRSSDLNNWHEIGYLTFTNKALNQMGYMIECPNLIFVNKQPLLIFCPQGLDKKIASYHNIYPNTYLLGKNINLNQAEFKETKVGLQNLDDGFDVYATQAFNAPDGKAYALSWVGLPDSAYPTDNENWANTYSQVKELEIKKGQLYQHPVNAIKQLRYHKQTYKKQMVLTTHSGHQYELKVKIPASQKGILHLAANTDLSQSLQLIFDTKKGKLIVDREKAGSPINPKYGTRRQIDLPKDKKINLDIFIDGSLCEVFINHGRHVMTLRFVAPLANQTIAFSQQINYKAKYWQMLSIL